jgi:predicted esterase
MARIKALPLSIRAVVLCALASFGIACRGQRADALRVQPAVAPIDVAPEAADGVVGDGSGDSSTLEEPTEAPATQVRIAPSSRGGIGAWLVSGPFRPRSPALDQAPVGVDEALLAPRAHGASSSGANVWTVLAAGAGALDLKAAFPASGADAVAYAGGTLHVEHEGTYFLLLSVDDGVRVSVDGSVRFQRDVARPVRTDDDVIRLTLSAGDHSVLLKFHQHGGAWMFRARVVDATFRPAARVYFDLPGTTRDDAVDVAKKLSTIAIHRRFDASLDPPAYHPRVIVKFPEGAPLGVERNVLARVLEGERVVAERSHERVGMSLTDFAALDLPALAAFTVPSTLHVNVAGKVHTAPFVPHPRAESALVHAARTLARVRDDAKFLRAGSLDSVRYVVQRLTDALDRDDADTEAVDDEAREVEALASQLERGEDPYERRTGPMRRALRSTLDGEPSEVGVYVPPGFKEGANRVYPLVVGLHGLNGTSMGVLRWMFGGDDTKRDQPWEDRHVGQLPPFDGFVMTPFAHGNSLYRELGEVDVMHALTWAIDRFPIDRSRITITGPSMGGIGAAAIPLHHPHVFAGAAPLCGYHSAFVRSDIRGRSLRPWETYLAEERSNVFWAENGAHLPLWIVHGTQDLPEENSGVLIDRYEKLQYPIKHDHPEAGHNVWQQTYEDLRGLTWLSARRLDALPRHVRFKTSRTRWDTSAWVRIDELAAVDQWGEIDAHVSAKGLSATTKGIAQLTFTRQPALFPNGEVPVVVDGQRLRFDEGEPLVVARESNATAWRKGAVVHAGAWKHGRVTGPLRDAFSEPLMFVYGNSDEEAAVNAQVAKAFAAIRGGVRVAYPVISDDEFLNRHESLANERALFLIGRTNRVRAALELIHAFPIRVDEHGVTVGQEPVRGREACLEWPHSSSLACQHSLPWATHSRARTSRSPRNTERFFPLTDRFTAR